jgi:hypothetical protein
VTLARPLFALTLLASLGGCAGYAADYWGPKADLIEDQLPRYGFTGPEAQCMRERLTKALSVWQLRQLADLAERLVPGGGGGALGPRDFTYVAGLVEDPAVGPEVGRALEACGVVLAEAAPPPAAEPALPSATAEPVRPLRWIDLGAAETGQAIAVDITTVVTAGDRREGWFRLTNPGEAGPQPVAYRLRIDCPARTITPTAVRRYAADGNVAEQRDYASGGEGPLPVEEGTVMEIAWKRVCG